MHARYYNPAIAHFMSPDSVVPNPDDTYSYDRYAKEKAGRSARPTA